MQDPTFFDTLKTATAAAVLWLGGETGRVIIAGGLGGLVRWWQGERRRIRDGAFAMTGGMIVAVYMWPLPLLALGWFGGSVIERTPEHMVMSGFLMGTLGVSFIKIVTAMIESRVKKMGDGDA